MKLRNNTIYLLKGIRKLYLKLFKLNLLKPLADEDNESVDQIIYEALTSSYPSMIARFGSTELTCLCNFQSVRMNDSQYLDYITGKIYPWWWDMKNINQLRDWSGFFPATIPKVEQFCELFLSDISQVDVLGSWLPQEKRFEQELMGSSKVNFELLNPYFSKRPWTRALKGKKVLVVHPFAQTIERQYKKRLDLFQDELLPDFHLSTVKAVQSIAGEKTPFNDWFEALEYMKAEIDKHDYDICLIGCGAYGFSLAAHVKRMGKKGFHIGGSLQLLFGIRGKRWENTNYNPKYNFSKLINQHWVKPDDQDKPINADTVEGACYW